jgi:coenzyme PQQ synthesis protein D (PqqD)
LLSLESAVYYGLDSVGSRIWELMQEPIRVSEIRDVIAREYDVGTAQCEADVIAFLREVAAKGLIAVSNDR